MADEPTPTDDDDDELLERIEHLEQGTAQWQSAADAKHEALAAQVKELQDLTAALRQSIAELTDSSKALAAAVAELRKRTPSAKVI